MPSQPKQAGQRPDDKRPDDEVLAVIARYVDVAEIPPELQRHINTRFVELIDAALARRPAHRPRTDYTGQMVEVLMAGGRSQAAARQRVASIFKRPLPTVARAHNRYRQRQHLDKSRR
jgi:hypothetical protein